MVITITFCPECGTTIFKEADAEAFEGVVVVQTGTVDGGRVDEMGPKAELWVKHRMGWMPEVAGTVQKQEF
jgi:hypothetical protein